MAYLRIREIGANHFKIRFEDMGNSYYPSISVELFTSGGSYLGKYYANSNLYWDSSNGWYYTNDITISGLQPDTFYRFAGFAQPSGSWTRRISDYYNYWGGWNDVADDYGSVKGSDGTGGVTTFVASPDTPTLHVYNISGKTVTFRVETFGNTEYVQFDLWGNGTIDYPDEQMGSYQVRYFDFNMANYDTYYGMRVRARKGSNTSGWSSYLTYWTDPPPKPATPSYAPSFDSGYGKDGRGNGSMAFNVGAISGATSYTVVVRTTGGYEVARVTKSYTNGIEVTGLGYGQTYIVNYFASNGSGDGNWSPSVQASTLPQTPSISATAVGKDKIKVSLASSMSGNWHGVTVYMYLNANGAYQYSRSFASDTDNIVFEGLPSGTTYYFYAESYITINGSLLTSYNMSNKSTQTTSRRPTNWAWYSGDFSVDQDFSISASEWNAFQMRINEFRGYENKNPYTFNDYDTYDGYNEFTKALSGRDVRAYHMNQVVKAIDELNPTGISLKGKGDDVFAWEFNRLKDRLNAIV